MISVIFSITAIDSTYICINKKTESFTNSTWNKPNWCIPLETSNMPDGGGRRPLRCYHCMQIDHYTSECPNLRAKDDYAPVCRNYK